MSDDTQDIVARLRGMLPLTTLYRADMYAPYKAADLIEQQAAEIERLGRELNRAKYGEPDFSWEVHQTALDEALEEAARLRDALNPPPERMMVFTDKALHEMGEPNPPWSKQKLRVFYWTVARMAIKGIGQEYDRMVNLQDKLDSLEDARRESIISKADELQNQCYEELFQAAWQLLIEIDEFFEDNDGSWIDGVDPGPLAADHLRELLSTSRTTF